MSNHSFAGGIHPPYRKTTAQQPLERATDPAKVIIPLQQHAGGPCQPLVKVGDLVKVGQKIGEAQGFISAPVHASVSGKVTAIAPHDHPAGGKVMAIVIESDGQNELAEEVKPRGDVDSLSADAIRQIVREAGIVGLGGAAFPTQVKLSPPPEKKIDTFLLNGAECEPYITCDHRLMVEQPDEVVCGLRALMKAIGVSQALICVEDNKPDAAQALREAAKAYPGIGVMVLHTKYPQGSEKQMIKAALGREVPSGGLPMDVGVVVSNVGTAVAVARAIKEGLPLVERAVTVTGSGIKNPRNLVVKVGTLFSDLIEQCGGLTETTAKVINGGPMMGIAQHTVDVPVVKGTSCILALDEKDVRIEPAGACIKCARCADACPMQLVPLFLRTYSDKGMWAEAEQANAMDCIECGSCSYVCPARLPLVHSIRLAKIQIRARKQKK